MSWQQRGSEPSELLQSALNVIFYKTAARILGRKSQSFQQIPRIRIFGDRHDTQRYTDMCVCPYVDQGFPDGILRDSPSC